MSLKSIVAAGGLVLAVTAGAYAQTPGQSTQPADRQDRQQPADRVNQPAGTTAQPSGQQPTGTSGQQPADRSGAQSNQNQNRNQNDPSGANADALPATASPLASIALGALSAFGAAGTVRFARRRR